jgi:hypothetical protein
MSQRGLHRLHGLLGIRVETDVDEQIVGTDRLHLLTRHAPDAVNENSTLVQLLE